MQKRTTIAITGLPQAGKTSFTQRLITGNFITSQPTFGVDVEFAEYMGLPLQIWDMGGHMAFRKHIWHNYVKHSAGLIYIFDASNFELMDESVEWFWECYSWVQEKQVPILFLANKWDIVEDKEEAMEKIVKGFRLNEIATKALETPFRFFFVSVKTGAYLSEAMNWLVVKQFIEKRKLQNKILSFDIFVKINDQLVHIHDNSSARNPITEIINSYKNKWLTTERNHLNILEEINYDNHKVLFIANREVSLLVVSNEEFVDRASFSSVLENIESVEMDDDINAVYTFFEDVKNKVSNSFQVEISSTLSCDLIATT